jgi:hypothetical protein
MDYSDGVKYSVFRLVLLFATDAVSIVFGKGLLWVIASVLPASWEQAKQLLIDDRVGSLVAAATMILLLGLVFFDDGKKHAAYDDWDATLIVITLMVEIIIFFFPMVLYNPLDMTSAVETFYYIFYFPCRWVMLIFGADIKSAAAIGIAVVLGIQLVLYEISYNSYRRKHPFVFKKPSEQLESGEEE